VNVLFDRVPRLSIDLGDRRVPAFRSLGIIGFFVGLLFAIAAGMIAGTSLTVVTGVAAAAGFSFFAWAILRRGITGAERLVLLEHVWVAYGAVALYAWAAGTSTPAAFDVLSSALAPFLLFGRLGCTTVGCCHGPPASTGIRYGPEHLLPERLVGVRLLPTPLIEAGALAAISVVALAAMSGRTGLATVWFLVSYAVVRFGTEGIRGDIRPALGRVSVPRIMAVIQFGVGLGMAERWLDDEELGRPVAVTAVLLGVALLAALALVWSREPDALAEPDHLDEAWRRIVELHAITTGDRPTSTETSLGMSVAVSHSEGALHVSLAHPEHPTRGVAASLGPDRVEEVHGITHMIIGRSPTPTVGDQRTITPKPTPTPSPTSNGTAPADAYFARPG